MARAWASAPETVRAAWGQRGGGEGKGGRCPFFDEYSRRAHALAGVGSPPGVVVDTLVRAVRAEQPQRRYWCGLDAYLLFRPLSLAPDWIVDRINVAALPRVQ